MPLPPPTARTHPQACSPRSARRLQAQRRLLGHRGPPDRCQGPRLSACRRGCGKRGEAVHDMWVQGDHRPSDECILDAVACTDAMPYVGYCDRISPDYAQLVGLNLFHGFRTAVKNLFPQHPRLLASQRTGDVPADRCAADFRQRRTRQRRKRPQALPARPLSCAGVAFGRGTALLPALVPWPEAWVERICPWFITFRNLNSSKESA
jgi:hypothetical protein